MKPIMMSTVLAALILVSCSSSTKEAKEIHVEESISAKKVAPNTAEAKTGTTISDKNMSQDISHHSLKRPDVLKVSPELSKFYTIFNDGAQIAPKNGKPLLLVFGQPADPYTQKLQHDVITDNELAKTITGITTPVYINAAEKKLHKFMHNGDLMDVDTKTLVGIYHLEATPTLIFMDDKSQSIFMVPGYMPPKQFEVTLRFVKDGVWKGKDRKNGEVYKALKEYYQAHNIKIGEPKK